ncbi:MAG: YfjI family protein, partial [Bryobacteraceae bacterium]
MSQSTAKLTSRIQNLAINGQDRRDPIAEASIPVVSAEALSDWPEPIPFTDERVQQLPANILPGILGEYSRELSRFTETPPELSALAVVGVVSVAAAGKVQVEAEPGYTEPVNIYVCPVLESGNRKTAVVTHAAKPLVKFEIHERDRLAPEIKRLESERKTKLALVEKLRKNLKQADKSEMQRIADLEAEIPIVPQVPVLFTSDTTAERLEVLLEANSGRAALISDEGGPFDVMSGRYNSTPNLDVFLKAHCQAPVRVHRMGRTTLIDKPHLTVLLSPQPAVLSALRDKGFIRDRGLLARFLFALPQSPVGTRKLVPSCISARLTAQYEELITKILEWQPSEPVTLQLSRAAYREWKEFQHTVEVQMADGGSLCRLRDWGSKLPGAALRLAGLLHTVRHAHALSVLSVEIVETEIQIALEICAALVSHAIAVFGIVSEDPALTKAKRLIRWLLEQNKDGITKRDCFRAHQPHVFEKV